MKEGQQLIDIIRGVLIAQNRENIDTYDFQRLYELAKFHSLENFLYYGMVTEIIDVDGNNKKILENLHRNAVLKSAYQDAEQEQLSQMLEEQQIKHLFLKGSLMKKLYPSLDMRSMADLDILVEPTRIKDLIPLMKNIGYRVEGLGGNHDIYYKPPFMNVEIHRKMIDESHSMSKYYHNIWEKVMPIANKKYAFELSKEDFFIYMVAHFAKHYQNGGTGIRSIIDIYLYLSHYKQILNWDYINTELAKLKILPFAQKMISLSFVWFEKQPKNDDLQIIENYIINSGTYGTFSHALLLNDVKSTNITNQKKSLLLKRAFPSYKKMVTIYPILKYLPFLLPLGWIVRLIKAFITKRKIVKRQMLAIKRISQEDLNKITLLKNSSGLEVKNEDS